MNQLGLLKQSPLTIILIVLCLALYIPDMLGMNLGNFMAVGPGSLQTEPWTLVTAMFAHGSIMHLVFNMISLWYMGSMLESMQGTPRFALLYFASGIVGNLAFSLLSDGYAVGASGAIFGLMGAFIVLVIAMRKEPAMRSMLGGLAAMVAINVINSFRPGIALEAHFGGLATGALLEAVFLFVAGRKAAAAHAPAAATTATAVPAAPVAGSYGAPDAHGSSPSNQGVPQGMIATPEGYRSAADVYNDAVNKKRMAKRSRILAIVVSLALTAAAFGAMAFSYMGLDFSTARVIGSAEPRTFDAQESAQWAGDDLAGLVQVPSDWRADHAESLKTNYKYSYQPSDGEGNELAVCFQTGDYKTAADAGEGVKDVKLGDADAIAQERKTDGGGIVTYYIDRSAMMKEGTQAYSSWSFAYEGERPAWIDESMAAYVGGSLNASANAWVVGELSGSATLGRQSTQWAGDEKYGYVQLPTTWVRSLDADNGTMWYVMQPVEGSGGESAASVQFMDYRAPWNTLQSALESNYENPTFEHVTINGVDAHMAKITSESDGTTASEFVVYMNPTGSYEDAFVIYVWLVGDVPFDCDSVLATYIPSKQ